jgi:uncharacterized RmlC-like cupin family protein
LSDEVTYVDPDTIPLVIGNAAAEGTATRGWFIGHFLGADAGPAHTTALEIKWATHAAGEHRTVWASSRTATTVSILIQGRFHLRFPGERNVVLAQPGDYVLWPPDVPHVWEAEAASVVLTVRWPSQPGDAQDIEPASG